MLAVLHSKANSPHCFLDLIFLTFPFCYNINKINYLDFETLNNPSQKRSIAMLFLNGNSIKKLNQYSLWICNITLKGKS